MLQPFAQAEVMLVKNAQNLMQAVIKTVQAAEAACMKVSSTILYIASYSKTPIIAYGLAMVSYCQTLTWSIVYTLASYRIW